MPPARTAAAASADSASTVNFAERVERPEVDDDDVDQVAAMGLRHAELTEVVGHPRVERTCQDGDHDRSRRDARIAARTASRPRCDRSRLSTSWKGIRPMIASSNTIDNASTENCVNARSGAPLKRKVRASPKPTIPADTMPAVNEPARATAIAARIRTRTGPLRWHRPVGPWPGEPVCQEHGVAITATATATEGCAEVAAQTAMLMRSACQVENRCSPAHEPVVAASGLEPVDPREARQETAQRRASA